MAARHAGRGAIAKAEAQYRKAIKFSPKLADAHHNLGVALSQQGRADEAFVAFQRAYELAPDDADTTRNLAASALQLGHKHVAIEPLMKAVELTPEDDALRAHLVQTLSDTGRYQEAVVHVQILTARKPANAAYQAAEGAVNVLLGRPDAALPALRKAYALAPQQAGVVRDLAACLRAARFADFDAASAADVLVCLAEPSVEPQDLARTIADLLRFKYARCLEQPGTTLTAWADAGWTTDELVLALLLNTINVDPQLEVVLRAHRTDLLTSVAARADAQVPLAYLAALAKQCFANEHVWGTAATEQSAVDALLGALTTADSHINLDVADSVSWLTLAMYEPLHVRAHPQRGLSAEAWPASVHSFVRTALEEPWEEQSLVATRQIQKNAALAAIVTDAVSQAVQAQYEQSPYPRWVSLGQPPNESADGLLRRLYPHYPLHEQAASGDILIAGCGTGRHALMTARRDPEARVVAIDLSATSLAHAERKAREFGVTNVEFLQLDILDLPNLGQTFGFVESFGVIHHMRDPAAGLAALNDVTLPGGAIKLGLYSRRARAQVNAARARIEARGLRATAADMVTFRDAIMDGSEAMLSELMESSDLYATSALRDLLFHVQEHQFDASGLQELLAGAGLSFLGFYFSSAQVPLRYDEMFPDDPLRTSFANWDQFEALNPMTFAGCFQFWAQKPAA